MSVYGNKDAVDEELVEVSDLLCLTLHNLFMLCLVSVTAFLLLFFCCTTLLTEGWIFLKMQIIKGPADSEGALDAFVSVITGPPGPNPVTLMPKISLPVLVLWGNQDPFTPIDGPVGKYFSSLPSQLPNISLHILDGVGHCPHDDKPDLVHEKLLPWLLGLPSS